MFKMTSKKKKINENEKKLKKIHGTFVMNCTNLECNNYIKVQKEEKNKKFLCLKCNKGILKII